MLRPVRRPIAAVLAVSGLFVGCGGGPSDTEQVHDTVEAFGEATAAKDYQRLCDDLLAPKLVEKVESAGLPCELALKQGLGEVALAAADDRDDHRQGRLGDGRRAVLGAGREAVAGHAAAGACGLRLADCVFEVAAVAHYDAH